MVIEKFRNWTCRFNGNINLFSYKCSLSIVHISKYISFSYQAYEVSICYFIPTFHVEKMRHKSEVLQLTWGKWGKPWFTRRSLDPKSRPHTSRLYLLSGYYRRIRRELKGKTGTWELGKRAREDSECSWEICRNRNEKEGNMEKTKKRAIKSGSSKSKQKKKKKRQLSEGLSGWDWPKRSWLFLLRK